MEYLTGFSTDQVVDEAFLGNALLLFPQIKKEVIQGKALQAGFCLLEKVIGYGRTVTKSQMENTKNMQVMGNRLQWAVMGWIRPLFTIAATPVGSGLNWSTILFTFEENYGSEGMILSFADGLGDTQQIILTSGPTAISGAYQYNGKLYTSNGALTFNTAYAPVGTTVAWQSDALAQCDDTITHSIVTVPSWMENYTTTSGLLRTICSTGIQAALWVEMEPGIGGGPGGMCWMSTEDDQLLYNFTLSWEVGGWYGPGTVSAMGIVGLTNSIGNQIQAGQGVIAQVQTGNVYTYSWSFYNQPANYETFKNFIDTTIITWSINQGLTPGVELDFWVGINLYNLLQNVYKFDANQSGGCCYVKDYETGNKYQVAYGIEFRQYYFSGFTINLRKCAIFDNTQVNTALTSAGIPLQTWFGVLMPDATADGTPLIQYYSHGGCGTSNAFIYKYIPGTIDPGGGMMGMTVNTYKGYQIFYEREGMFIVNNPAWILVFNGTNASTSTITTTATLQ